MYDYYLNAILFISCRTGKKYETMSADKFIEKISAAQRITILHDGFLIVLMAPSNANFATAVAFKTSLASALKEVGGKLKDVVEFIVVEMSLDSSAIRPRLSGYVNNFHTIVRDMFSAKLERYFISFTFLFKLCMPMREAFPMRPEYYDNLCKAYPDRQFASMYRTRYLTDGEQHEYGRRYSLSDMPHLPADDVLCIWNGYRKKDIVLVESMTPTTHTANIVYSIRDNANLALKESKADADDLGED